jgi:hypothetical protein
MKISFILFCFSLVSVFVEAGPVTRYTDQGTQLTAQFENTNGCLFTYGDLAVWKVKKTTRPTTEFQSFVLIEATDMCSHRTVFAVYIDPILENQVQIRPRQATFKTTLRAFDYFSGSEKTIVLDLTWTAQRNKLAVRSNEQHRSTSPSFSVRFSEKGISLPATLSGTVSVEGYPPSRAETDDATINRVSSMEMDVERKTPGGKQ